MKKKTFERVNESLYTEKLDNGIEVYLYKTDKTKNFYISISVKYGASVTKYRINDKVIQLVNDVDNNVFNGDIGYIENIYTEDGKTVVEINYMGNTVTYRSGEYDKFNLAYAISIHKVVSLILF